MQPCVGRFKGGEGGGQGVSGASSLIAIVTAGTITPPQSCAPRIASDTKRVSHARRLVQVGRFWSFSGVGVAHGYGGNDVCVHLIPNHAHLSGPASAARAITRVVSA